MPDAWAQFSKDVHQWANEAESAADFRSRTPATTKAQMVERGQRLDPDVKTILDALEAVYGYGFADELSGNVDSPVGHFYRVDRWIVVTDDRGFHSVWNYGSVGEAQHEFHILEEEFSKWDNGQ